LSLFSPVFEMNDSILVRKLKKASDSEKSVFRNRDNLAGSYVRIRAMKIPVVFMGSPDFALPTLKMLAEDYQVRGVVTQPDRPSGRGKVVTSPVIKLEADRLGLPVIQPPKLRDPAVLEILKSWSPEVIIVAAYGQILRQDVLDLPKYACVNVHASLLPRWRGAAPIQAAILAGDAQTGITIMRMDAGLDSGPILSQSAIPITVEDTAGSMSDKLAGLGASLLQETLPGYLDGSIAARVQDESQVTKAPMLDRAQGEIHFDLKADYLARMVRAYHPWPGCFTTWRGEILKIHRAHALAARSSAPGARLVSEGKPAFGTGEGLLVLDELQPAGKRRMSGDEFLRGDRYWAN
jgi:methionyl-tRNA formyltransferase